MTNIIANIANNLEDTRSRHSNACCDVTDGNLSFQTMSSKSKGSPVEYGPTLVEEWMKEMEGSTDLMHGYTQDNYEKAINTTSQPI